MKTVLITLLLTGIFCNAMSAADQLRVVDPQQPWYNAQGTIDQAVLSVKPAGAFMEFGMYLTFSAKNTYFPPGDSLEVQFQFDLPPGSVMYDSWLWIGDTIIRAEIMDRWTAESIYEEIVNRRRDPSILFRRSDTHYELRIFPMRADESRKVKLAWLVPCQWTPTAVTALLPTNLVRTSYTAVSGLSVLTWPGGEWVNPRFAGLADAPFVPAYDSTNGDHERADLPWGAMNGPVFFAMDSPMRDGMYVNRFDQGGAGYYQLAILPSTALDLGSKRKVAVLFDNTSGNSTVTPAQLLASTKATLYTTMTHQDSFNLIFSGAPIRRASLTWLPADSATVDSVFAALGSGAIANYSNLPALLLDGIYFIQANGGGGELLLVANSDQFGDPEPANQLIEDLLTIMPTVIPIHTVEYQTGNFSYHWIGGRYYYGNEYFYTNLTRLTGGNQWAMRESYPYGNYRSFGSTLHAAFGGVGGFISSFDLYTKTAGGYCYGRINNGVPGQPVYIDQPIVQTGRYYGSFPMTVEVSGAYGPDVFSLSFLLDDTSTSPNDTLAGETWAGGYVRQLETQTQTNDVISEIVTTSIDERVLSIYSAFLALEPSRGGEVCYDCLDESGDVTDVEDSTASADTLALLSAWPNPFNASTTIRVGVPTSEDGATLAIYDVLGREVRSYDLDAARNSGAAEVTWNGTDDRGASVNSGVYFVVYRGRAGAQTLKLMLLK